MEYKASFSDNELEALTNVGCTPHEISDCDTQAILRRISRFEKNNTLTDEVRNIRDNIILIIGLQNKFTIFVKYKEMCREFIEEILETKLSTKNDDELFLRFTSTMLHMISAIITEHGIDASSLKQIKEILNMFGVMVRFQDIITRLFIDQFDSDERENCRLMKKEFADYLIFDEHQICSWVQKLIKEGKYKKSAELMIDIGHDIYFNEEIDMLIESISQEPDSVAHIDEIGSLFLFAKRYDLYSFFARKHPQPANLSNIAESTSLRLLDYTSRFGQFAEMDMIVGKHPEIFEGMHTAMSKKISSMGKQDAREFGDYFKSFAQKIQKIIIRVFEETLREQEFFFNSEKVMIAFCDEISFAPSIRMVFARCLQYETLNIEKAKKLYGNFDNYARIYYPEGMDDIVNSSVQKAREQGRHEMAREIENAFQGKTTLHPPEFPSAEGDINSTGC